MDTEIEIKVHTFLFRLPRHRSLDLPFGIGRRVILTDGQIVEVNHWVSRRYARHHVAPER
jgi:hypothetical protein